MTWVASEQDAFIVNPALNSVYGKILPPTDFGTGPEKVAGYQGAVASMLDVDLGLDHFAECTVATENIGLSPPNNHTIGPAARMSFNPFTGKFSCYALEFSYDGGHFQLIWERDVPPGQYFSAATDGIVRNNLAPQRFDIFAQVGDVLRIEAVGSQITGKLNGVIIFGPVTDTRLTGTRAGLEGYPENSTLASALQVSDFRCGSLPSGAVQGPSFDGIGATRPLEVTKTPIEEVLRAKLLEDSAVAALLGDRLEAAPAVHPTTTPWATFQLISSPEGVELDGTPDMAVSRVQLSFMSEDWEVARAVLVECRRVALAPATRGTWLGVVVDAIHVLDKRDMGLDPDTNLYRYDLDLEIFEQLKP